MTCPRKKYCTTIKAQGHTWDDVIRVLNEIIGEAASHGEECGLVAGGDGSGWIDTSIEHDMTKERYNAELAAWVKRHREEDKPPTETGGAK